MAGLPNGPSGKILKSALHNGTCSWVARRLPLGLVLATAHDMSREYRSSPQAAWTRLGAVDAGGWHPPLPAGDVLSVRCLARTSGG
jgi:hypothetical protein